MTDAPERIYLQDCGEGDCEEPFSAHHEVTWCEDQIHERDVPYVRADKYDALAERADALHKALRKVAILSGPLSDTCCLCLGGWAHDRPDGEWHETACLAAPSAPKEGE